ncbi:hypothetical protein [Streptomyces albus]|uniref:hypothetical protein n=1 Tax=Streptomyces albus TaxID=1888 RepID=UPI00340B4253
MNAIRMHFLHAVPGEGTFAKELAVETVPDDEWPYYYATRHLGTAWAEKEFSCRADKMVLDRSNDILYYVDDTTGQCKLYEFRPRTAEEAVVLAHGSATYRSCFWQARSGRLFVGAADRGRVDVFGKPRDNSRKGQFMHGYDLKGDYWKAGVQDLTVVRVRRKSDASTVTLLCALSAEARDNQRKLVVKELSPHDSAGEATEYADDQFFLVPADACFVDADARRAVALVAGSSQGVKYLDLRSPDRLTDFKDNDGNVMYVSSRPRYGGVDDRLWYAYTRTGDHLVYHRELTAGAKESAEPRPALSGLTAPTRTVSLAVSDDDILCGATGEDYQNEDLMTVFYTTMDNASMVAGVLHADQTDIHEARDERWNIAVGAYTDIGHPTGASFALRGESGEPVAYLLHNEWRYYRPGVQRVLQDENSGKAVEEWSDGRGNTVRHLFGESALPPHLVWGRPSTALGKADTGNFGESHWPLGAYVRGGKVHVLRAHRDRPLTTMKLVVFDPNREDPPEVGEPSSVLLNQLDARGFKLTTCCEVDHDLVLVLGVDKDKKPVWWLWNAYDDAMVGAPQSAPHSKPLMSAFRGYDTAVDPTSEKQASVLRVYSESGESAWTVGADKYGAYKVTHHPGRPAFRPAAPGSTEADGPDRSRGTGEQR